MKLRTALIITTGFGLLLLAGYLSLPYAITRVMENRLFQNGIYITRLDIDRVGPWSARINSLEGVFEAKEKQGPVMRIVLQDILLGYRPEGLINKQLVSIDIKRATISGMAEEQGQTSTSKGTSLLLPSRWMKFLPMDRLTIENADFKWQAGAEEKDRYRLMGDFKYNKGVLESSFSVDGIKGKRISLMLFVNEKDQLNIKVYPVKNNTREVINLQSQLEEMDNEIKFSGKISVDVKSMVAEISRFDLDKDEKFSGLINSIEIEDIVELKFLASSENISAKANIELYDDYANARVEAQHNFNTLNGEATIELKPFVLSKQTRVLSTIFSPWEYPFDVISGEFSGRMKISWESVTDKDAEKGSEASKAKVLEGGDIRFRKKYTFKAENFSGFYNESIFIGLNAEGGLEDIHGLRTLKPVKVEIGEINTGVPVKAISFKLSYVPDKQSKDPVIYLQDFVGNAFEGKLYSNKIRFDPSKEKNSFIMELKGLSIKKLLELEKQQGINGTGVIDGYLPIEVTSEGVFIQVGKLEARAPGGIIQYRPENPSQLSVFSRQEIKFAMEVLQNFHYQVLKSDVHYKPNGELLLKLKLEGRNPEMKVSNPVRLNVNVEQNVLTSLKSLRLANDIGEKIGKSFNK